MTGTDVAQIRAQCGWSAQQLADLLGVHPSTIYRWESVEGEFAADPLQRDILITLQALWRRSSSEQRLELRTTIDEARAKGGTLRALSALLNAIFTEQAA